ncbi:hypothetical protein Bccel_3471 [Pseudobacteroides cellulosolvens ATCC 35603 = DSM 2933]|uniref:Uncharacterized protein n=1 Tax=Pseudobacteroides cellulosolvens ATCC 35603 = DSM 2933 TaxID=398512 RepID=A0A0L6JS44_9FIRM|nr:hypothetical protein Bccel_3471 [Pseudobacteroides cellulosolvens ATCC 35603 = DSM 2933]
MWDIIDIIMPRVPSIFSIFTFCLEVMIILVGVGFMLSYLVNKFIR